MLKCFGRLNYTTIPTTLIVAALCLKEKNSTIKTPTKTFTPPAKKKVGASSTFRTFLVLLRRRKSLSLAPTIVEVISSLVDFS